MNWNIIGEYLRESGFFPPETDVYACDSVYMECSNFYISVSTHGQTNIVISLGTKIQGKRFSVVNTYPYTEDTETVLSYLREDLDNMGERLDRKITKEFPNIF
jgi:hypothetical protein